ncbi:MAG: S8 family serine peptidase [Deltaproteobacteria bacterium]|nr:S8 family serine peptidase [Deltaproteobacteria bacterium]
MSLALVLASAGTQVSVGPPSGGDAVVFLDGGAARVVERTGPGQGIYRDPGTARSAPVRFGNDAIVTLPQGDAERARVLTSLALVITRELSPRRGVALVESTRPGEDALALAARLVPAVEQGILEEAWPNLAFRHRLHAITVPPNDPLLADQYALDDVDIEEAWAISTGSPEVSIMISDTGCDLGHPELVDKVDNGADLIDGDGDESPGGGPSGGHGTACAGLAAAATDNGEGVAGACPDCRLICVRMIPGPDDPLPLSADVESFELAVEVDAAVVSNSWGMADPIPVPNPLKNAIIDAQRHGRGGLGAVVTFAAGNESHVIADDELPAVEGVLAIGAVSNIGELTQYTNGGAAVDVVAPTGATAPDIRGPDGYEPGDYTTSFSGTSSATPIVSGIAGLLIAHHPELTADEINAAIVGTARQSPMATPDENGHDSYFGYGLVQPAAALRYYDPPDEPPGPEPCGSCANARLDGVELCAALCILAVLGAGARRRRRATTHPS